MPLVKIFHGSNFTEEAVKKVNQTIHLALVECFDIPKNDTFQLWIATDSAANFVNPNYLLTSKKEIVTLFTSKFFVDPAVQLNKSSYYIKHLLKKWKALLLYQNKIFLYY